MNKKVFILAITLIFLTSSSVTAQDYKTAIGIRISSQQPVVNNSITIKHFISNNVALEGLVSFGDPFAIGLLAEKHNPLSGQSFSWFVGGGAYFAFSGTRKVGVQGITGLDYKIPSIPINLSVDWKPELNFSGVFSFEPAAVGLSARFTLN